MSDDFEVGGENGRNLEGIVHPFQSFLTVYVFNRRVNKLR